MIATPQGLQYPLSQPEAFAQNRRQFQVGDEIPLDQLAKWLLQAGYRRESLVAKPGEFAMRGDIVDVYPLDQDNPIRMEFFGDEVDTIKTFDLSSQKSTDDLEKSTCRLRLTTFSS